MSPNREAFGMHRAVFRIAGSSMFASALLLGTTGVSLHTAPAVAAEVQNSLSGPSAVTRRLSEEQYRRSIADIFGSTIKVGGRFEPEIRREGLLAVGASQVSFTGSGLEQYESMAQNIADQVVSEQHRTTLLPCKPADAAQPDDACTKQVLTQVGRLLYRRPPTDADLQLRIGIASDTAKSLHSFYTGLSQALSTMLVSPNFLFRKEVVEPDPSHPGQFRLDAYSKASQLSFLLWNTTPDRVLLDAAASGELNTDSGLAKQVARLMASPRLDAGVRAFFSDMLGFSEFPTLSKDPTLYPKFTFKVVDDAREQTLRTVIDHLLRRQGDYRRLFTTPRTFLTARLGSIYGVPVIPPDGWADAWVPYSYTDGDPRSGILSQVSFVALHAHPGRSSPTLRGKAIRELVLCQKVPSPPANVNFTLVNDVKNSQFKTTRDRLTAHRTEPTCAGCHKIMDPIGLAMESFDSDGGFRSQENGVSIDTSGELDGMKFSDVAGLALAVSQNPAASSCLVNRVYAYSAGRLPVKSEAAWLKSLEVAFAGDGYKFPNLLRQIATSEALYQVAPPATGYLPPSESDGHTQMTKVLEAGR